MFACVVWETNTYFEKHTHTHTHFCGLQILISHIHTQLVQGESMEPELEPSNEFTQMEPELKSMSNMFIQVTDELIPLVRYVPVLYIRSMLIDSHIAIHKLVMRISKRNIHG